MSLSKQIFVALAVGIALGLFFGEQLAFLSVFGSAFVQLLQITVLPYVAGSLIFGFGSLSAQQARLVFSRGGALLLLLWALALGLVFLSPLALPAGKGGSFFSAAPQEAEHPIDWVSLYIPSNPFYALANNVVPAVVVFAVLAGIALMGMKDKDALLRPLAVFNEAMGRVGALVTKTTPYGIFAIAASTAATMRLDEFERLQGFLVIYAGLACLLTFWLLPGLVAATTHVRHRRLVAASQDALVTAFVTSNLFIVLPQIVEVARALLAEGGAGDTTDSELVDVLVPTSFNFPHSAKLLSICFVPFVAWYAGLPLGVARYPELAGAGLLAVFGSINAAIPFLLDLAAAAGGPVPAVRGLGRAQQPLRLDDRHHAHARDRDPRNLPDHRQAADRPAAARCATWRRARSWWSGSSRAPGCCSLACCPPRRRAPRCWRRCGRAGRSRPGSLLSESEAAAPAPAPARGSRLDFVRASGRIRVGFDPDAIPWAFLNADGVPVGYDAELAQPARARARRAARARACCRPSASPTRSRAPEIDVVMSGVRVSPRAAELAAFSRPYAEESIGFLVLDHRREEFSHLEDVRGRQLRIAIVERPEWIEALARALPQAEVVPARLPARVRRGPGSGGRLLTSWERACA